MKKQPELLLTGDGSFTFHFPDTSTLYHSRHGAVAESELIYINYGFQKACEIFKNAAINILEVGYGSGLNVLLTLQKSLTDAVAVNYTGIELFPLDTELILNAKHYISTGRPDHESISNKITNLSFGSGDEIIPGFILNKREADILEYYDENKCYHLVYYDPFQPSLQPELWQPEVFINIYRMMITGGILVTYCSKVIVQDALRSAGFKVEKLTGPYGKREVIRAIKS